MSTASVSYRKISAVCPNNSHCRYFHTSNELDVIFLAQYLDMGIFTLIKPLLKGEFPSMEERMSCAYNDGVRSDLSMLYSDISRMKISSLLSVAVRGGGGAIVRQALIG